MTLPLPDIRGVLAELDELFEQNDGVIYDWLDGTPEQLAAMERISAEWQSHQEQIDAKIRELQAISAAWSTETWAECRQTQPDLFNDMRRFIAREDSNPELGNEPNAG